LSPQGRGSHHGQQPAKKRPYPYAGFVLIFDPSSGSLCLFRESGYHAGMMEGLIIGGTVGLLSIFWLLWVVMLPGEYIVAICMAIIALVVALSCFSSSLHQADGELHPRVYRFGKYPATSHAQDRTHQEFGADAQTKVASSTSGYIHMVD
jgi:hypothetical protein